MSVTDIVNSTIVNMRWFNVDGKQVLRQLRQFKDGASKWEDVGEETEIPFTERFLNDEHKPHDIEARNADNIIKDISKIHTESDWPQTWPVTSEIAKHKEIAMRLYAMLIRICGSDVNQVKEHGVYFNGNNMGYDLVRFMMVAYGAPWSDLTDKLHLGSRAAK